MTRTCINLSDRLTMTPVWHGAKCQRLSHFAQWKFKFLVLMVVARTSTGMEGGTVESTSASSTTHGQHPLVLYAVNAGGKKFTSNLGVTYLEDSSEHPIASGGTEALVSTDIARAPKGDVDLYITERYGLESFHYEIPAPPEGKYTLVLKFAEVAFHEPGKKRFSVVLNKKHVVLHDLDIFDKVGFATAHDEFVSFIVKDGYLKHRRKTSKLGSKIQLQFVKGHLDNPKICAIALVKGTKSEARAIMPIDDMLVSTAIASPDQSEFVTTDKSVDGKSESYGGIDTPPQMDHSVAAGTRSVPGSHGHHHSESDHDRMQNLPILSMAIAVCLIALTILLESYLS
eukprot:m.144243 g.144243  ORF g.144243 m.144243 type:complete len:342 (+) comp17708_c0_seq1:376-1401(+)